MSHTVPDSKQKQSRSINHLEKVKSQRTQTNFLFPFQQKKTNSLVVRSACMTCCLLNDREKDGETSKDLVSDEVVLQNEKLLHIKDISLGFDILSSKMSLSSYLDFCRSQFSHLDQGDSGIKQTCTHRITGSAEPDLSFLTLLQHHYSSHAEILKGVGGSSAKTPQTTHVLQNC